MYVHTHIATHVRMLLHVSRHAYISVQRDVESCMLLIGKATLTMKQTLFGVLECKGSVRAVAVGV